MKLDFLISSLSGGGAEKVLTTLAAQFSQNGNDVSILSLEKRPQFYNVDKSIDLVKKEQLNKSKIGEFIGDFKFVYKFLKSRKSDVVISFLSRCNLLSLFCQPLLKNKVVVCDRNNPKKEHSKFVFYLSCNLYRLATAVVVQTQTIKSYYPDYLQDKIYVIENPVDMKNLERQLGNQDLDKNNTIVSMGRLEPQKDFSTLIKAFEKISDKNPDWNVEIYGIGDMKDILQKEIDEIGLTNRIRLCGRTETPFLALKKAKVFVLSSFYEGFPNVLCEGMYAGLPCISSNCVSGPSELINEGVNGYLFPIGDTDLLAEKLDMLINNDNLCNTIGKAAKRTVEERLSVEQIYHRWDQMLKGLI